MFVSMGAVWGHSLWFIPWMVTNLFHWWEKNMFLIFTRTRNQYILHICWYRFDIHPALKIQTTDVVWSFFATICLCADICNFTFTPKLNKMTVLVKVDPNAEQIHSTETIHRFMIVIVGLCFCFQDTISKLGNNFTSYACLHYSKRTESIAPWTVTAWKIEVNV